jgi:ParB/RepB/Spo0J family partition protein
MIPEALQNDQTIGIPLVPIEQIYIDHEFNCRGWFSPTDCIDLAKDIALRGLQQPITIRPLRTKDYAELKREGDLLDKGFKYHLIVGHRRYTSYKINEAKHIPAIIKAENMPIFEQRDLNAIENLQRKELNFAQEAQAIKHYWICGWTRIDIAQRVTKSAGWVQQRIRLLEMPEEVQTAASQGYILPSDMAELSRFSSDPNELLKMAGVLRDRRAAGQGRGVLDRIKKTDRADSRKIRSKRDMEDMLELIQNLFKQVNGEKAILAEEWISPQGNMLCTRVLAWACGVITTYEIHKDIQEAAKVVGLYYNIPKFSQAQLVP